MRSVFAILAAHFAAAGLRKVTLRGLGEGGADVVLWARPLTLADLAAVEESSRNAAEYISHVLLRGLLREDRVTPAFTLEDAIAMRRSLSGALLKQLADFVLEEGPSVLELGEPSGGPGATSPAGSLPPPPPPAPTPESSSATPPPPYCADGLPTLL